MRRGDKRTALRRAATGCRTDDELVFQIGRASQNNLKILQNTFSWGHHQTIEIEISNLTGHPFPST
jgi:hypothetical protein